MKKIKFLVAVIGITSLLGITSFAAVSTLQNGAKTIDSADIVAPINENAAILDDHIDNVAGADTLGHIKIGTGLQVTEDGSTNIDTSYLIELIYPVGSIYMSVNNVSPQNFIGGEWEALQDRFLIGAGGSYDVNTTGGEVTHTLTIDEMPNHSHTYTKFDNVIIASNGTYFSSVWWDSAKEVNTSAVGGGQPHNNMPPYLSVYMWKRIG